MQEVQKRMRAIDMPAIVGADDSKFISGKLWFPKPSFQELKCMHRYEATNAHGYQNWTDDTRPQLGACGPCRPGFVVESQNGTFEKFGPQAMYLQSESAEPAQKARYGR